MAKKRKKLLVNELLVTVQIVLTLEEPADNLEDIETDVTRDLTGSTIESEYGSGEIVEVVSVENNEL